MLDFTVERWNVPKLYRWTPPPPPPPSTAPESCARKGKASALLRTSSRRNPSPSHQGAQRNGIIRRWCGYSGNLTARPALLDRQASRSRPRHLHPLLSRPHPSASTGTCPRSSARAGCQRGGGLGCSWGCSVWACSARARRRSIRRSGRQRRSCGPFRPCGTR